MRRRLRSPPIAREAGEELPEEAALVPRALRDALDLDPGDEQRRRGRTRPRPPRTRSRCSWPQAEGRRSPGRGRCPSSRSSSRRGSPRSAPPASARAAGAARTASGAPCSRISATAAGKRVHEPDRAAGEERHSGRTHERGPAERDHEHDALARGTGRRACPRTAPPRRQAARERARPGRPPPPLPRRRRRRERAMMNAQYAVIANPQASLDAQQARIRENGLERVERLSKPLAEGAQHRRRMTPAFAFLKECGKISSQPSVLRTRIRPKGARNVRGSRAKRRAKRRAQRERNARAQRERNVEDVTAHTLVPRNVEQERREDRRGRAERRATTSRVTSFTEDLEALETSEQNRLTRAASSRPRCV